MMIDWQVQLYWQQSWNVNLIFANNWQGRPRSGSKRRFCKSSQWWCDLIKWAQILFSTFMSNSNVKSLSLKTEQSTTDLSAKIEIAKDKKKDKKCLKNYFCGILLPKLFWPTVRINCSTDWEKLLKYIQGWRPRICKIFEITIYSSSERSEQFLVTKCFSNCSWRFFMSHKLEQL